MIDHLLICVPPTPNGGLHLGHLSGPYLGCDVLARALRQRGKTVLTVAGIDDHQGYVHCKARKDGVSCSEVVQHYGASIRDTWKKARFDFDLTPSAAGDADYATFVQDFFARMQDAGAIERKAGKAVYSGDGAMHLFQGYLRGTCPHCDRACDGHMCEDCSLPNSGWDIKDMSLSFPETGQQLVEEDVLFVDPSRDWDTRLGPFADAAGMSADRRAYLQDLEQTVPGQAHAAVGHVFPWGLPLPASAEMPDRVIDVWFEMAAAFLYYPEYDGINWQDVWQGDTKTSVFFGVDNSFYVGAMFPYLYSHLDGVAGPDFLHSNHFLYLEGQKFSTSRNHAIWGADFFASEPVDIARFYLACHRPEDAVENFAVQGYADFKAEKGTLFAALKEALAGVEVEAFLSEMAADLPSEFVQGLQEVETHLTPEAFSVKRAANRLDGMLSDWATMPAGAARQQVAARLLRAMAPITPALFEEVSQADPKVAEPA